MLGETEYEHDETTNVQLLTKGECASLAEETTTLIPFLFKTKIRDRPNFVRRRLYLLFIFVLQELLALLSLPTYLLGFTCWHPRVHRKAVCNMWDSRYSEEGYAYGVHPNDFLKATWSSLRLPKNSKCLVLAEGQGRNAIFLAEQGMEVTAIDSSKVGLDKAQNLAAQRGVEIKTIQADLAEYDFHGTKNNWDAVVMIFGHFPPPIRTRVLDAIPEILRPGGYFLTECYTPAQLEYKTGGPLDAALMYSRELFESCFGQKKRLDTLRNEELVRDVVEGKYHTGKAAVVQFIGQKPTPT